MWIAVLHFIFVYAIPFFMSLNRVGQYPFSEQRTKSILVYWMINIILLTLEQSIKTKHEYYFIAKSILCLWLYNNRTNGAWWIFRKINGVLGRGFNYDLDYKHS